MSIIYSKYQSVEYDDENMRNYKLVKKYLLNDSSLAQSKKPIIWIHMVYDINARWWPSFSSRNTDNLNQPYQYLTMKSIIDKCGEDFNVCLIDDDTFTFDFNRIREFCERKLTGGYKINWCVNVRPNITDIGLLKLMKKAGCRAMVVGYESGSSEILKRIKKGITVERMEAFAKAPDEIDLSS